MEERYKEQLRRLNTSIYRVIQTREWILLDIDIYMNILYQLHKLQCLGEFSLNLAKKNFSVRLQFSGILLFHNASLDVIEKVRIKVRGKFISVVSSCRWRDARTHHAHTYFKRNKVDKENALRKREFSVRSAVVRPSKSKMGHWVSNESNLVLLYEIKECWKSSLTYAEIVILKPNTVRRIVPII